MTFSVPWHETKHVKMTTKNQHVLFRSTRTLTPLILLCEGGLIHESSILYLGHLKMRKPMLLEYIRRQPQIQDDLPLLPLQRNSRTNDSHKPESHLKP